MKYNGYEVRFIMDRYEAGGNLYVGLEYYDKEFCCYCPYGNITVNLYPLGDRFLGAIDINNMGTDILKFIEDIGLAKNTGQVVQSGFCVYPIYKFSERKLRELCSWK